MTEKASSEALLPAGKIPGNLIAGITYPLWALTILGQNPRLWGCVAIPILLNLGIGTGLYLGLVAPLWQWVTEWTAALPLTSAQWVASLPEWAGKILFWLPNLAAGLDDVLRWLLAIALLLLTGFLLVQFGAILGAPWYGNLSEQIEQIHTGHLPTAPFSPATALRDIGRAISFQVKKLLLALVIALPLLLLGFYPVLGNGVASVGWVVLGSLLVGMDFLDPPLERRRLSFRRKLGLFARTLPGSFSFSLACLGLVSIPFLNLLAIPLCVAAGTLYGCDRILPQLQPPAGEP